MKSTSCKEIAQDVLERCIAGKTPKELPATLLAEPCARALFGVLVEGLADRFDPALCDAYARLFSQAVEHTLGLDAAGLVARYNRVRKVRPVTAKPRKVFVLSRVTLGADVAVTSVVIAAAKRRFPHAEIVFVGPAKNFELFAGDPHIHFVRLEYLRGGLQDRLSVWETLKQLLRGEDCLVLDPDSRLTQLGMLPVCGEDHYHLFESRSYGADTDANLPQLTAQWAQETLGAAGCKPLVALGPAPHKSAHIAISLGVGENPAKRVADPFEEELLRLLAATGIPLCIDEGAGGEEAARVKHAIERADLHPAVWSGSFAGFARAIAAGRLYVGYDSAGQHVAAACGIPLISIFVGFPVERMFQRWRPAGDGVRVIRVDPGSTPAAVIERVKQALPELTASA